MHRLAVSIALTLLTLAGLAIPAHAQVGDPERQPPAVDDPVRDLIDQEGWSLPEQLSEETLRLLFYEIALLEELDAFTPDHGEEFIKIHDAFGDWPDTDRTQAFEVLKAIDAELAEQLPAFNILPTGQNRNLQFAVDRLPPNFAFRLLAGETEFVTGFEYVGALQKLLTDGSTADFGPGEPSPDLLLAELADALERLASAEQLNEFLTLEVGQLRDAVDQMSADRPTATDGSPWLLIAGGAALVGVVLGMLVMVVRRKPREDAAPGSSEVIEAHRLLTGARRESEVAAITTTAASRLAEGADAVLLRKVPEGLRIASTTPIITSSALNRIIATGQPMLTELDNDPLWPSARVALAAVPVVHDGRIIGALAVWRTAEQPFDDETRSRLELLVPAVGGALISAEELGSMETMAMVDGLTSLGNRRRLDGDLETALASAMAAELPVGFAMIDVDHFKIYNDTHGHTAGDVALQSVARMIAACVRESDVVYRYGGEEFSMLLPGATPDEARAVAERVRASVEQMEVAGEQLQPGGRLTVSVGVATLATGPAANLKERADAALYRAKSNGRNQVAFD